MQTDRYLHRASAQDGLSPRKPLDTASSAATASSIPAFEKPAFETPAFEKPAPQQPSSPPPSNSSGYFARFDAGDAHDTATHGDADDPPPPPYNEVCLTFVHFCCVWLPMFCAQ